MLRYMIIHVTIDCQSNFYSSIASKEFILQRRSRL